MTFGPIAASELAAVPLAARAITAVAINDSGGGVAANLALWGFDETAGATSFADSSENANTATGQGTGQTVTGGVPGNALQCDDSPAGYATAPAIAAYDVGAGDFEVSADVFVEGGTSNTQIIVSKDATGGREWVVRMDTVSGTHVREILWVIYGTEGNANATTAVQDWAPLNTWFEIKVQREGTALRLLLNDSVIATGSIGASNAIPVFNTPIGFGFNHFTGFPQYLRGKLDNVRISDVLT